MPSFAGYNVRPPVVSVEEIYRLPGLSDMDFVWGDVDHSGTGTRPRNKYRHGCHIAIRLIRAISYPCICTSLPLIQLSATSLQRPWYETSCRTSCGRTNVA